MTTNKDTQVGRFKKKARELGTDESPDALDKIFDKLTPKKSPKESLTPVRPSARTPHDTLDVGSRNTSGCLSNRRACKGRDRTPWPGE